MNAQTPSRSQSQSQSARIAIVGYSLGITGFIILFLLLAQPLHMRFNYSNEENFRLIDIVLPTFLGYLGAASHFIFNANNGRDVDPDNVPILKMLIHGPFLLFISGTIALFYTYYTTHIPLPDDAARQDYLKFNDLSRYFSILLGLLAVTVSVISAYLFGAPPPNQNNTSLARASAPATTSNTDALAPSATGTTTGD